MKYASSFILAAFLVIIPCFGQVDPTFNAVPGAPLLSPNGQVAVQPDGKIIVSGNFQIVNSNPRSRLARLAADGTIDTSFNCTACDFSIGSVVAQPDGKLLVAGASIDGFATKLLRLNSDGSVDGSFTSPFPTVGSVEVLAVLPDGKIMAAINQSGFHYSVTTLYRLNPEGAIDTSFNYLSFDWWNARETVYELRVLPDGRMLIGGKHQFGYVFRVNTDGTRDTTFESPLLATTAPGGSPVIYDFGIQPDGRIVFVGSFTSVNGINRQDIARLNSDGSLDQAFTPQIFQPRHIEVLFSGKMLIGDVDSVSRLNADGTPDSTFQSFAAVSWTIDVLERIVYLASVGNDFKVLRANTDGSPDTGFVSAVLLDKATITALASQSDGKILLGGTFNRINGLVRPTIARVNADGSLDASFSPGSGFDGGPLVIVQQADGKLLVGGGFQMFNGESRPWIVRLNSTGTLDTTFNAVLNNTVFEIAVQADGKILVGGSFSNVNGALHSGLIRLNADGTTDNTFNVTLSSATVMSVIPLSDGKIVFGGSFSGVNGFGRTNIARLNSNGTLDTLFNAGTIPPVTQVVRQTDGTYYWQNGLSIRHISADGAPYILYSPPSINSINKILLRPDDSIIVGGTFTSVGGYARNRITRLKPDGSVDRLFLPSGANAEIKNLLDQPNEKLFAGGAFTAIAGVQKIGVARLFITPIRNATAFDFDGDGRADISVTRPGGAYIWYQLLGPNYTFSQTTFGQTGDVVTPADFDGDGITDIGIFRAPSGDWWYQSSITGQQLSVHWGASGDIPLPGDIDGDGKADFVIYRNGTWYRLVNGQNTQLNVPFGAAGDKPLLADFDGDGKADPAIFRPSTGTFWYAASSAGGTHRAVQWGISTDVPVPADYDGDGRTDFAVYRPAEGAWYVLQSSNGALFALQFGISEDKPVPADYDGDGKADVAVFRPSTGIWYLLRSTSGFTGLQWGIATDIPSPAAYIPQ